MTRKVYLRSSMVMDPGPGGGLLEIGVGFMHTETELVLKSRQVVPARLVDAGFKLRWPEWDAAAADLVRASL